MSNLDLSHYGMFFVGSCLVYAIQDLADDRPRKALWFALLSGLNLAMVYTR